MTILDYTIIAEGIAIIIWHVTVSWQRYSHKRFIAKLKHGNDWHIHLNVKEYSFYGAKFWLKKHA